MATRRGPRRRLRREAEFDTVFRRGRRQGGVLFLVVALPNGRGYDRMGLAVSRRVGGAVARNRARRLLRESFQRVGPAEDRGLDLVVVARPALVGCRLAEVEREFRERLEELRRAARPGRTRPAPAR